MGNVQNMKYVQTAQASRLLNYFMLNSAEHEIYPAHKC